MSGAALDEALRVVRAVHRLSAIVHPGPDAAAFNARLLGAIHGGMTFLVESGSREPFVVTASADTLEFTAGRMEAEAGIARAKRTAVAT